MSKILDSVDQRTQLAGENRLELLLFQLDSNQWYGINVFKVREILHSIPLTKVPGSHQVIRGISHIRGNTIPIYDLNQAIGGRPSDLDKALVVLTEYNQMTQGFLVTSVIKIVNTTWSEIHPPPAGTGNNCYLTAVTEVDKTLVEIIDVEKVLQEVAPAFGEISSDMKEQMDIQTVSKQILVCDDSRVARTQIKNTLDQLGIESILLQTGKEALDFLKGWSAAGGDIGDRLLMVISDVEMPEMDGYKLTTQIRSDPNLKDLYVVLHTSMSGAFNSALVEKVGASRFIPKFQPDTIAETVLECIKEQKRKIATKQQNSL